MGLTQLGEDLAPVIPALREVPVACPWCRSRYLRHVPDTPEVSCLLCGYEAILEPPRIAHGPAWR